MKRTWTRTAFDCYELNSDCARCSIPTWGLAQPCRVKDCLPDLIERLGPPKIYFKREGELAVLGEKEIGAMAYQEKIMAYVIQHEGVTLAEIVQAMTPPIPTRVIEYTIANAYRAKLLDRQEEVSVGNSRASKIYRYWPV